MAKVAIVDYGMGNIHSVSRACEEAGLETVLTSDIAEITAADGVILPGVGAYKDAVKSLKEYGLFEALIGIANSGKPFMGICLGMQLLLTGSDEFGYTEGLGLIQGKAVRFENEKVNERTLKVPQIAWNNIKINSSVESGTSPLKKLEDDSFMYFVHSYFAKIENEENVLTNTTYGSVTYCSSVRKNNIFGFQFHPEKSGETGIDLYRGFKNIIEN